MKIFSTTDAPAAIGPYSQAVRTGNLLFTSGQIALDPLSGAVVDGGIREQTHRIMQNLAAILRGAGLDFSHVVKTTCFLADMNDFASFNEVYAQAFGTHKPARSCVAVRTLPKGVLAEVELITEFD